MLFVSNSQKLLVDCVSDRKSSGVLLSSIVLLDDVTFCNYGYRHRNRKLTDFVQADDVAHFSVESRQLTIR